MYRAILINIFLLLTIGLSAQQMDELLLEKGGKNLLMKEWSVNNGLTSNSIGKIGKTKQGFLFICTFNGISFFDGKNFQNYNSANVPALKANMISDYCVDKDSTFWIATYSGVVAFKNNIFFVPENLRELESKNIQTIDIDKNGTLWIGSVANGLFKFANGRLEKVKKIALLEKSIISLIYSDNEGSTWIGTESGLLYRYDGKNYTQVFRDRVKNSFSSAVRDKKGNYYFGTKNGLFKYENGTIVKLNFDINFINDITVDDSDKLWLSTNSGIFIYDQYKKELKPFCPNEEWASQIIQTIYFDYDGNIWIGTYRKGVLQVRIGSFKNFPMHLSRISEVPSALVQVNDSTIWVGTDEGNLYSLTNAGYKKVKLSTSLNNSRIKSIFIDSKKNTWVCSYYGLLRISNGTEKILNTNTGFKDNTIREIVENNDGSYWVATSQSGLYRITKDFKVISHFNTSTGLSSNFVMTVVKGKNEEIYVATKNGLDIIENGKITKRYNTGNGLVEDMVFNIYQDDNNILWIATIGGLSMIKENKITNFNKKDGLLDDKIFDVIEDTLGYIWLPTINSILRIEKKALIQHAENKTDKIFSVSYGKSDGMYDQQYVGASKALKLLNGNIALNTLSGISILNPSIASSVKSEQILLINSVGTESENYRNKQGKIILPSSNKYLQIDYSYIDFIHPNKVDFNYLLEPFDHEWQHAGSERFVRYTNIPPGDYIFRVKAFVKTQGGKVLEKSVSFTIKPTFYESIWFKIIIAIAALILIWFIYILRVRNIKHQKDLLEKEVAERTAKISQQKEAIEKNLEKLEFQKAEIAEKNEEILVARNRIEQAYINLKMLSDLGKEITSSLSEEDIIKTVYQNINLLMDADIVAIGIYDKKENLISFKSIIYKGKKIEPFSKEINTMKCIISYSIANETAIVSNNFSNDYPSFGETFPEIKTIKPVTSLIVLPFRSKDEVTGVLTAQSFRKDSYSDYHFNLMANLAVYVGIAIENTKTYEKIQVQKDELENVNTAKDKMFSIIGHDLRGPVGTIKSFLDIIIENPEMTNSENNLQIFKTMQQSLGSAYSLLDNLLLWARSQRDQLEFEPSVFNMNEPVKESVALVMESARNKGIAIETEVGQDIKVYADKNMITTVLRNLISNAIKFTKKNGLIKVIVLKINQNGVETIEVKVVDNGIGISKANIEKILKVNEAFSTLGTEKEQGSGLGISICIDFLKKHRQKLFVENNKETSDSQGTTFKFYLPVKQESNSK